MYCIVSELTPLEKRGELGSLTGLVLVFGILCSFVLGLIINVTDSNDSVNWRIIVLFPIFTNILQLILMPRLLFESPRFYLISKQNEIKVLN